MPIKYQVKSRTVKIQGEKKTIYVARNPKAGEITTEKIAKRIEQATSLSITDVEAVLHNLGILFAEYIEEGRTVVLDHVGRFTPSILSKSSEKAEDFSVHNIKRVKMNYRPSVYIVDKLKKVRFEKVDDKKDEEPSSELLGPQP